MPFCNHCGAEVSGAFCAKCGRPMEAGGAPAATAAEPAATAAEPAAGGAKPKRGPLPYILIGCLGLLLLGGAGMLITGWFVARTVKQAGFDPELMQSNPALAAAKMIAAVNPDLEVVRVDDGRGVIEVREKSSGKVLTLDLEGAKEGRIVFKEEGKGEVEINTGGGGMEVRTPEGTARYGSASESPNWLPAYGGAQGQGLFSSSTDEGRRGTLGFQTSDTVEQVTGFYERELGGKGFQVKREGSYRQGEMQMETLTATGGGRKVQIAVTRSAGSTTVAINWEPE